MIKFNTGNDDEEDYINPLMVMVFGAAAGLILILIIVTLAVRVRCSRHPTISRDNSKVVVTTITDLEFNDNLSNDRLPLSSGKYIYVWHLLLIQVIVGHVTLADFHQQGE